MQDLLHGVAYLEWQTVKVRTLKAGTLEKIIQSLINSEQELDSCHVHIFLDTYREFTSPETVVQHLLKSLAENYGTLLERPLKQLLLILLENYPEDFSSLERDECVISMLEHGEKYGDIDLKNRVKHQLGKINESLNSCNLEVLEWMEESVPSNGDNTSSPSLDMANDFPTAPEDLLNYGDRIVAQQLTLVDAVLLKRLLPHQCLAQERAKNTSKRSLDSVQATICHFNAVCARVQSTLLSDLAMTQSLRLRLLIKWIDIAQFLLGKIFVSVNVK